MPSTSDRLKLEANTSPRSGIYGAWDRLVGPGTTAVESALILGVSLVFTAGIVGYAMFANLGWDLLQLLLVATFAFDLAGGIPGNTTLASTRWWHRPFQSRRDHFFFAALHVHPLVLAAVFTTVSWVAAGLVYGYLLVATVVVLSVPEHLQRPVAATMVTGGIVLTLYGPSLGAVFAWVAPFLYLKLVLGHSVKLPD
jgi:hypothetical protein